MKPDKRTTTMLCRIQDVLCGDAVIQGVAPFNLFGGNCLVMPHRFGEMSNLAGLQDATAFWAGHAENDRADY